MLKKIKILTLEEKSFASFEKDATFALRFSEIINEKITYKIIKSCQKFVKLPASM